MAGFGVLLALLRSLDFGAAALGLALGVVELAGAGVGGVVAQGVEACAGSDQAARVVCEAGIGVGFGAACLVERLALCVDGAAGVVEVGLRAAQLGGLAAALGGGVALVASVELFDGVGQRFVFGQFAAVFLKLVEGVGHVAEQLVGQRRQGFGERLRQAVFVRLLRQLRLAQLDQGVHQRAIAGGAEVEQALVDGAPVVAGLGQHLAAERRQRFAQVFAAQHHAGRAEQPQIAADAPVFHEEEPAIWTRPACAGGHAAAQREVVRRAVVVAATEFDPGVAGAPLVAVEQQVPGHFLVGVAVRFDARRIEVAVEQEGQAQRQHLGFAGAIVAAQQQATIVEPEFFAVVVKHLDQAQPQGLPARALGLRQRRRRGGGVHGLGGSEKRES